MRPTRLLALIALSATLAGCIEEDPAPAAPLDAGRAQAPGDQDGQQAPPDAEVMTVQADASVPEDAEPAPEPVDCEVEDCGAWDSPYDRDGWPRTACTRSRDCERGSVCRFPDVTREYFHPDSVYGCLDEFAHDGSGYCVPRALFGLACAPPPQCIPQGQSCAGATSNCVNRMCPTVFCQTARPTCELHVGGDGIPMDVEGAECLVEALIEGTAGVTVELHAGREDYSSTLTLAYVGPGAVMKGVDAVGSPPVWSGPGIVDRPAALACARAYLEAAQLDAGPPEEDLLSCLSRSISWCVAD